MHLPFSIKRLQLIGVVNVGLKYFYEEDVKWIPKGKKLSV